MKHHGRKKRRGQARRLPRQLKRVNLNTAGIDVGAEQHWVAVPEGRDPQGQDIRCFGAFTADLYEMAAWLRQCEVESVVMESTGVYWIPLYELLEEEGFSVKLVDAAKVKNVPGRKSDVVDCRWLQQLDTYGLLQGAFRPADEICVLRSYMRQRAMLVESAAQHIQHMQKALTQMNLKLQHVISDITGKTGMQILRAIVQGERDAAKLARYRDRRCKNDQATIRKSLQGHYRTEHVFALQQALALYDFYQQKIRECDERIEAHLGSFEDLRSEGSELGPGRKRSGNEPSFEVRSYLHRMTGVDLTAIDGINALTGLKVISETGLDMTRWKTVKHFTSWLALCPGTHISGGKVLQRKSRASANRAAAAFRLAAHGLHNSHSALGAFLRRKKAHLGPAKAITATAHKLARLFYFMLSYGTEYVDQGQDYYENQYRKRMIRNLNRRARHLGYKIIPINELTEATGKEVT
jgi:transposase